MQAMMFDDVWQQQRWLAQVNNSFTGVQPIPDGWQMYIFAVVRLLMFLFWNRVSYIQCQENLFKCPIVQVYFLQCEREGHKS